MSVLFRRALVAAALAIASMTPAAAQKLKDGTAIVITPSGEMKMMQHNMGTTVPPGYTEVVGHTDGTHTTMIMVGGKMYMKTSPTNLLMLGSTNASNKASGAVPGSPFDRVPPFLRFYVP